MHRLRGITIQLIIILFINSGIISEGKQAEVNYCDYGQENFLCGQNSNKSEVCQDFLKVSFAEDNQKNFVNKFNTLRKKVAKGNIELKDGLTPVASNMNKLEWNDVVAEMAQASANRCTKEISNDNQRTTKNFTTGEYLEEVAIYEETFNEAEMMKAYSDLVEASISTYFKEIQIDQIMTYSIDGVRVKYLQLLSSNSFLLGCCGGSMYIKESDQKGILVCHFYPSGLEEGKPVYEIGDNPCANCAGTCENDALCDISKTSSYESLLPPPPDKNIIEEEISSTEPAKEETTTVSAKEENTTISTTAKTNTTLLYTTTLNTTAEPFNLDHNSANYLDCFAVFLFYSIAIVIR